MISNYYNAVKDIEKAIEIAVTSLKDGNVIIFPTETVYGVGCDIFNDNAVHAIFELKKRPLSLPLTAHCSSIAMVESVCEDIPSIFYRIAAIFLPGPLSVILKKKRNVSDLVSSGKKTLAVRIPDDKIALELINKFGKPVAATSANLSGQKAIISVNEIPIEFDGKIDCIIEGGKCKYGSESTIISLIEEIPVILRQGVIPKEKIEYLLGIKTM
jgi:L-threonylcarbamoyladenylate synthase